PASVGTHKNPVMNSHRVKAARCPSVYKTYGLAIKVLWDESAKKWGEWAERPDGRRASSWAFGAFADRSAGLARPSPPRHPLKVLQALGPFFWTWAGGAVL